jgi:methionyl-tRNA formyltransferase
MIDVLFAGSPECAVPSLEAVARAHRVVAVLTNPPAPAGRSGTPVPTPVHAAAERLKAEGIIPEDTPIITPEKITQEVRDAIAARKPAILACFAYGKIFGPKTLALFPLGAVNLHPSILPRWRGCAPVPAAILARDAETGITVQRMALEMDAGDILIQTRFPLDGTETADSLLERAAAEGAPFLAKAISDIESGAAKGTPQDASLATFSAMLKKEDGDIDWTESAANIDARIRAFTAWPGAFTKANGNVLLLLKAHVYGGAGAQAEEIAPALLAPGTVIGIDKKDGILVQTGNGVLALERLQWRAKKPLDWKSFINGTRDFTGSILGRGDTQNERTQA